MKTTLRNLLLSLAIGGACFLPRLACAQGGVPLWANRYHGPGSGNDYAYSIAVDGSNNVYVTGSSRGNNTNNDYATIKYSSEGVALWTNRYGGPYTAASDEFSGDIAYSVAVDTNGNVYVTGQSDFSSSSPDYATIKYSTTGVPLWTNRYGGALGGFDVARSLAVDGIGNIYVGGGSAATGAGAPDYVTIKYSSAGIPLWTNRYNGPGNNTDSISDLAVDGDGNVYVTGYSTGSGTGQDYATIKYSGAGVPLWTNRYNGVANGRDQATAIVLDGIGNVVVTGGASTGGGSNNFVTIAYSTAGVPVWTNSYDGPENGDDFALSMAADTNGNIFVTGYSSGSNGSYQSYDVVTIAYASASGVSMWTNRFNGTGNDADYPRPNSTAVDANGNVFVTCQSVGIGSSYDYAVIAYSVTGKHLWTNRYNGSGNSFDIPWSMAVDVNGNVYVTGSSGSDYATIKYGPTVALQIEKAGSEMVLSWANAAFGLQSAPFVSGTFTNVSGATSPYTNSITGSQQFFRLKAN